MVESSDKYWQGKNVLVTGGGSGIGEALCHAFARRRCAVVVVVDVDLLVSQRVASALPAPTRGLPLQADVGQEAQVKQMLDKVQQEVGKVEAIVANAGIALYGGVQVRNEDWTRIFQVNVMQHVFLARHWLPAVKAQGGGHFLITASAAGLLTMVGALPYAVTKHAAVALAEWLAISHKEDGLIVSCLCPQAVRTNMLPGQSDGAMAGTDGVLEPRAVAEQAIQGMQDQRFLILPHPSVQNYMQRRAGDHARWLEGMQRQHRKFAHLTASL